MSQVTVTEEIYMLIVGQRIKKHRKQLCISQEALSKGILSQSALSLIEHGKYPVELDVLKELANKLNDSQLFSTLVQNSGPDYAVNKEYVLDLIMDFKGAWPESLKHIACDIVYGYFTASELENVEIIVNRIINNSSHEDVYYRSGLYYLARVQIREFAYQDAYELLTEVLKVDFFLNTEAQAEAWYYFGYVAFFLERTVIAQNACDTCLKICRENRLLTLWSMSLGLQGAVYRKYGRYHDAIESLQNSYEMMSQLHGPEEDKLRLLISMADNFELIGEYDKSERLLERTFSDFGDALNHRSHVSFSSAYRILGRLGAYKNDNNKALNAAHQAVYHAEQTDDSWSLGWSYLLMCGLLNSQRDKIMWGERALASAKVGNQRLLVAVASECLFMLTSSSLNNELIDAIVSYRNLALGGTPQQYPTLKLLPLVRT